MAVQTIIPQSNVLLADIRDTLNSKGSTCSNSVLTFFDYHANINHWSFRKPYSTNLDLFKLTDAQIRSINCGFTFKGLNTYKDVVGAMDGGMNGWVYKRPTGGTLSPYRVGDYVGYYADATPMIQEFYAPDRASNQFEGNSVKATAIVNQQNGISVSLADLGTLKDFYPAVYIKRSGGTGERNYVGSNKLSSGVFEVEIPVSDMTSDAWTIYPYITNKGNLHYTIPNVNARVINITTSFFNIAVYATRRLGGTRAIDYTITINNTSSGATWTNNGWMLRYSDKKFEDSLVAGEMSGELTSPVNVNANGSTTLTGVISNVSAELWSKSTMELWVSFDNGNQRGSFAITSNSQT